MHFSAILITAAAALASAGQVNFYSDTNCQNYIGERHPASFTTTGYVFSFTFLLLPPSHPIRQHTNPLLQWPSKLLLRPLG
jgi:hypothetical protein